MPNISNCSEARAPFQEPLSNTLLPSASSRDQKSHLNLRIYDFIANYALINQAAAQKGLFKIFSAAPNQVEAENDMHSLFNTVTNRYLRIGVLEVVAAYSQEGDAPIQTVHNCLLKTEDLFKDVQKDSVHAIALSHFRKHPELTLEASANSIIQECRAAFYSTDSLVADIQKNTKRLIPKLLWQRVRSPLEHSVQKAKGFGMLEASPQIITVSKTLGLDASEESQAAIEPLLTQCFQQNTLKDRDHFWACISLTWAFLQEIYVTHTLKEQTIILSKLSVMDTRRLPRYVGLCSVFCPPQDPSEHVETLSGISSVHWLEAITMLRTLKRALSDSDWQAMQNRLKATASDAKFKMIQQEMSQMHKHTT